MSKLSELSSDQLQNYLLNAVRHLESNKDQAEKIIPDIVSHMVARRLLEPTTEHTLTTLGYNVRWKNWHAKERKLLLKWLMKAELPAQIEKELGPANSEARKVFFSSTIERWLRMYGSRPNMENAVARWRSDLEFVSQL